MALFEGSGLRLSFAGGTGRDVSAEGIAARLRRGRAASRRLARPDARSSRQRRRHFGLACLDRRGPLIPRRGVADVSVLPDPPGGVESEVLGLEPLDYGRRMGGSACV